jgi:hypothetical protein
MPSIRAIPVRLPDPHLPHANWADAFEIDIPDKRLTALEAARLSLGRIPPWAKRLMAIRNALARLVGLKTGSEPARPGEIERIGMFPVLRATEKEAVLGLDDWHLDFRLVIEVMPAQSGTRIRVTTLVARKNLFGRLYIGIVTPFHRMIVPAVLRGAL